MAMLFHRDGRVLLLLAVCLATPAVAQGQVCVQPTAAHARQIENLRSMFSSANLAAEGFRKSLGVSASDSSMIAAVTSDSICAHVDSAIMRKTTPPGFYRRIVFRLSASRYAALDPDTSYTTLLFVDDAWNVQAALGGFEPACASPPERGTPSMQVIRARGKASRGAGRVVVRVQEGWAPFAPLYAAGVSIVPLDTKGTSDEGHTNKAGWVTLQRLLTDSAVLRVRSIGYRAQSHRIAIHSGFQDTIVVRMRTYTGCLSESVEIRPENEQQ